MRQGPLTEYDVRRIFRTVVSIDARDAASLLEIVHNGALDDGFDPFPRSVLLQLAELIPSDACVGYQEAGVAGRFRVVELIEVIGTPPSPKTERAFHTLGWQNPMHCRLHVREQGVIRLSDLLTRRQRLQLEYNDVVWRAHGIDDALRIWLPAPPGRARSVYIERGRKNYTERERTLSRSSVRTWSGWASTPSLGGELGTAGVSRHVRQRYWVGWPAVRPTSRSAPYCSSPPSRCASISRTSSRSWESGLAQRPRLTRGRSSGPKTKALN
jgi:hypothetical protein